MFARLHHPAIVCLAVIYGLVGLTGDSLHYLAQDVGTALRSISLHLQEDDHGHHHGFFHTHAPDNHLHYHRHHDESTVASADSNSEALVESNSGNDSSNEGLETYQQFHSEHACPLLTFVSNLKLGAGGATLLDVQPNDWHVILRDTSPGQFSLLVSCHLARGPPCAELLA